LGRNAIVAAARTILAYEEEHRRMQEVPAAKIGKPSLTSTIVHGGTGGNVVPDRCTLFLDRRVMDGEEPCEITDRLYALAQQHAGLPVELTRQLEIPAYYQPAETAWIMQLVEWSGSAPAFAPYGTNAWAYRNLPCATVVIGPGSIDQAHGATEWVELSELEKIAFVYAKWWGIEVT
jgi:acetylornithine deacetylase/succinyl-diaminopimelate desuccinylase-like protein